jgi:hypothetical protein
MANVNAGRIKVEFVKERTTKNYVVYSETSTSFVGTIYIRKETFNGSNFPDRLTITLEFQP